MIHFQRLEVGAGTQEAQEAHSCEVHSFEFQKSELFALSSSPSRNPYTTQSCPVQQSVVGDNTELFPPGLGAGGMDDKRQLLQGTRISVQP